VVLLFLPCDFQNVHIRFLARIASAVIGRMANLSVPGLPQPGSQQSGEPHPDIENVVPYGNRLRWGLPKMFVQLGAALWALAFFSLSMDLNASAAALFLIGLAMMLPRIFHGRTGNSRFIGWYESLKIALRLWF
jgi:hypothetical protein